jgi:adenosylhomocysteine nucleosidase
MRIRLTFITVFTVICLQPLVAQQRKADTAPIVILGAFGEEIDLLQEKLAEKQVDTIQSVLFAKGKLHQKQVVIALTGIGKVNAAMTTTLAIEHYRPQQIIFTGIAGGINPALRPGDIVIAEKTVQYDYARITSQQLTYRPTRNPFTGAENPMFFPADSLLMHIAQLAGKQTKFQIANTSAGKRTPVIVKGTVVTGDLFVASADKKKVLEKDLKADATEMEGAAVAQVCWQFRIPCLVIRSISDTADESAAVDMKTFLTTAATNSATLVTEIVRQLP